MSNFRHLKELLDETEKYLRSLRYSPYTVRMFHYNNLYFIRKLEEQGVSDVSGLTKSSLFRYQRHLAHAQTEKGLPLKPRTVNKKIESARVFLKHLAEKGYILNDLAETLQYVKVPEKLPESVLTHSQVRKIIRATDKSTPEGRRNRALIELMYSSGLRAGEVVGLNLRSVDFPGKTVRVTGKGNRERMVPVGETALQQLETYVKAVRPFLACNDSGNALFLNSSGTRLQYHSILRIVHEICDKAGIEENVSCHTFRRSCATELVRGGANIYHVKEILGHKSVETLKHYTKLTVTDLKKTHAKFHPRGRKTNQ